MFNFIVVTTFLILRCCTIFAVYDVSICAIFQDEAPYFKEWIEFHKLQGVRHFYLYNNNSQDNYQEILEPYIASGEVTLIQWPYTYKYGDHAHWIRIQCSAYMDCIRTYQDDTVWLAAIDVDEFLFCPNGALLPEFLKSYIGFGGVAVNWIKFGTSGVEDIPPKVCMIELLTHCLNPQAADNKFVKSIVQPKLVTRCLGAHHFDYLLGYYAVDANKTISQGSRTNHNDVSQIRINHYWTRTINYLFRKKIEGRQKRRPQFTTEIIMQMVKEYDECVDTAILRFIDELRKAMGFPEYDRNDSLTLRLEEAIP